MEFKKGDSIIYDGKHKGTIESVVDGATEQIYIVNVRSFAHGGVRLLLKSEMKLDVQENRKRKIESLK